MCYSIANSSREDRVLEKALGATYPSTLPLFKPIYAVSGFTHPQLPVLTQQDPKQFSLQQWGLIPSWTSAPDKANQYRVNNLNARADTIFDKSSFRDSIHTRRCIIPVTGFFEYRHINKHVFPYFIYVPEVPVFCLAGIYDNWTDPVTGSTNVTFSVITTEANELMAHIHNTQKRMPVLFTPDTAHQWLQPNINQDELNHLMQPFPSQEMKAHTIRKLLARKGTDSNAPEVQEPYSYPELEWIDRFSPMVK